MTRCPELFWQRNEYRSSFLDPFGRETSFGVLKTLPSGFPGVVLLGKGTQIAGLSPFLPLKPPSGAIGALLNGCDYSETHLAASGRVGTAPKLVWLPEREGKNCSEARLAAREACPTVGGWLLELLDISLFAGRGGRAIKGMLEESKPAVLRGLVLWPGCTAV